LGVDLVSIAQQQGIDAVGIDLPEYDITQADNVEKLFLESGPIDIVINSAAYTAVDKAESDPELAYAVNRDGAANLARVCEQNRVPLIHISTDYVFSGYQTKPYMPDDPIDPQGVYAKSKAAGEEAIRQLLKSHIIIRISWLFGVHGNNFVKTMLRLGRERETISVVDDQIGAPTYAGDLADALLQVAKMVCQSASNWGTYHYCNQGALTWCAFARKILTYARPYESFAVQDVISILTANYPTPAPRPYYSVLDCNTFDQTFQIPRRPWEVALKEMLAILYEK
jgi:dTDP-4-dehydrorhamnose reductase